MVVVNGEQPLEWLMIKLGTRVSITIGVVMEKSLVQPFGAVV